MIHLVSDYVAYKSLHPKLSKRNSHCVKVACMAMPKQIINAYIRDGKPSYALKSRT